MTTIKTIKSILDETTGHVQMKAEIIKLQASLVKADLEDNLKQKRKAAVDAAANLSNYLETIDATVNDVKYSINGEVENLKLQVALGETEGKQSIEQAQLTEAEKVGQVKVELSDYMTKMSDLKASIEAKVESYKA